MSKKEKKKIPAVSDWNSHGYEHMQINLTSLGKMKLTFAFVFPETIKIRANITALWVASAIRMRQWDCILLMTRMITGLRCSSRNNKSSYSLKVHFSKQFLRFGLELTILHKCNVFFF